MSSKILHLKSDYYSWYSTPDWLQTQPPGGSGVNLERRKDVEGAVRGGVSPPPLANLCSRLRSEYAETAQALPAKPRIMRGRDQLPIPPGTALRRPTL